MKKTLISIAVLACAAAAAQASDGTINFNGKLTAATCSVNVNNGGPDGTVTLPTTSVEVLNAADKVAGATSFDIDLSGCSGSTGARVFFETGATVNDATGRLINTAQGGATMVELELLDSNGASIFVGSDSQFSGAYADITDGAAKLNYAVQYHAVDATTPGIVTSQVSYTVDYQ